MFRDPLEKKSCSFERIYFSRGSDADIYTERKMLGELLCPEVLKTVNYDLKNTVFSFIPNTAEVSFYGMVDGLHKYISDVQKETLLKRKDILDDAALDELLSMR